MGRTLAEERVFRGRQREQHVEAGKRVSVCVGCVCMCVCVCVCFGDEPFWLKPWCGGDSGK